MPLSEIPALVKTLYRTVDRLEQLFPGRKFTPDGHLVGSIGEVVAAHTYGLELLPASAEIHDAIAPNGTNVQIKATQSRTVALRAEPDHVIVLLLLRTGEVEEIYNGPGNIVWSACGRMQKNGQRPISLFRLRELARGVERDARIAAIAA